MSCSALSGGRRALTRSAIIVRRRSDGGRGSAMKRGKRLDENLIKVVRGSNNQFSITLPRKIARQMCIEKGSVVVFWMAGEFECRIKKVM